MVESLLAARQDPDGRAPVEAGKRDVVRRVANELGVGHMGETHFLFGPDRFRWQNEFARAMGAAGLDPKDSLTVGTMRGWIRDSQPTPGLRPEIADLVICAWAIQEGRAWYRHGSPVVPAPRAGRAAPTRWSCGPSRCRAWPTGSRPWREERRSPVPSRSDYLTGASLTEFAADLRTRVGGHAAGVRPLVQASDRRLPAPRPGHRSHARDASPPRLRSPSLSPTSRAAPTTSRSSRDWPGPSLPGTDQVAGRSLVQASAVTGQLQTFNWERLDAAPGRRTRWR